jgi:ABC-2 type transport system permease protein
MTAVASRPDDLGLSRVTQVRVVNSEWIKFRTLRSSGYSLLATAVIVVGLGTLFSALRAHRFNQGGGLNQGGVRARFEVLDPTLISLRGVFLAQLAIGVLGVLVITGEYSTGMIRSSLAAVPRRVPVLVAKAGVFALVSLAVAEVSALGAFLIGQAALSSTHLQATLSTPHAARAVLGAGLYLTVVGLLAVGLGFIIRNTAGAIATLVAVLLVLPILANALPDPYSTDVGKYLPLNAGTQILTTTHADPTMLGPWSGLGLTALYALAALIIGAVVLRRRDA